MEDNDQNNNVDGFRAPDNQAPVSSVDGFVTNPRPEQVQNQAANSNSFNTNGVNDQAVADDPNAVASTDNVANTDNHAVENAKLKEQKKGLSIWLVVLLILLFAGASAMAVYFWQSAQASKDLDAQKAKTSQATQGQIDTLTKTNSELTTQNANLQKTVDAQQAYIASLSKTATNLKAACGNSCAAISIPAAPAGVSVTATPTPTASPAATATPTPTPSKTN